MRWLGLGVLLGRKEGRKEGRMKGRKEGKKEGIKTHKQHKPRFLIANYSPKQTNIYLSINLFIIFLTC